MSMEEYCRRFAPVAKAGQQAKPKKRSKYNNQSVEIDGFKFQSTKEGARYQALKLLERAGQICDLRMQVSYELAAGVKYNSEKRKTPAMRYVADFVYTDATGQLVVEDVKSAATRKLRPYRLKKHLMKVVHGIEIREV